MIIDFEIMVNALNCVQSLLGIEKKHFEMLFKKTKGPSCGFGQDTGLLHEKLRMLVVFI